MEITEILAKAEVKTVQVRPNFLHAKEWFTLSQQRILFDKCILYHLWSAENVSLHFPSHKIKIILAPKTEKKSHSRFRSFSGNSNAKYGAWKNATSVRQDRLKSVRSGFKIWFWLLLTVWPWTWHFTPPSLSFLICKMRMTTLTSGLGWGLNQTLCKLPGKPGVLSRLAVLKIYTKGPAWNLVRSSYLINLSALPSIFPFLFLIFNCLQGWASKDRSKTKQDEVLLYLVVKGVMRQRPHLGLLRILAAYYSIIPTPWPNIGKLASLLVGHLPIGRQIWEKVRRSE